MKMDNRKLSVNEPAKYRIRVQGVVDESWVDYFGGMMVRIEHGSDTPTESTLVGWVDDQAALLGALERLYNHGLPILSLELYREK
jgi:hypothetical protein